MSAQFDKILDRARAALGQGEAFAQRALIDFGDDGAIFVDGPSRQAHSGDGGDDADCTLKCSMADFIALAKGELDPAKAYLTGKLKVLGDMSVAIALAQRFKDATA